MLSYVERQYSRILTLDKYVNEFEGHGITSKGLGKQPQASPCYRVRETCQGTIDLMAQPPFYILFAHSSVSSSNAGAPSNALGHPAIQYQYADDSPLSLWPQHPNEHVLVLDFDPMTTKPPTVQSMSKDLIVSGLKVEEAPGAAAADENNQKNDRMYIIDTTLGEGYVCCASIPTITQMSQYRRCRIWRP